jgi:hypothetical protein
MRQRGVRHGTPANASLMFPDRPHRWQMDTLFFPVAASAYSIMVQAMTCSLSTLFLPHRFLAQVDTIVLFFLEEKSKEYLS